MKLLITSMFMLTVLSACNFKEDLKDTGDAVQTGAQNAAEAAKELPADLSKAMNKVEADIKE
jgi:hypothetical protein